MERAVQCYKGLSEAVNMLNFNSRHGELFRSLNPEAFAQDQISLRVSQNPTPIEVSISSSISSIGVRESHLPPPSPIMPWHFRG
jgi:hypothetical protein